MRHSPTRRSLLSALGRSVHLADRTPDRPRHRGPLAVTPAARQRHRALRLAIVIGLAATGFCLVLGLTGMVVALGGSAPPARSNSTLAGNSGPASVDSRPATGAPAASGNGSARRYLIGTTVARYHGSGVGKRNKFTIDPPGIWGISWKFSCPRSPAGSFTIRAGDDNTANTVQLSAADRKGHGVSWQSRDAGSHSLVVITKCQWAIKIVLPKS